MLINELDLRFLDLKLRNAFSIVYSQFWMQTNVDFFFYLHLVIIQKHYYEAKRVKPMLLQVAKPLNVNLLDLQMCILKLTMKMQAPKDMDESFDTNIMTKLWVTINNNALLTQWLSEYLKLAKIAMVLVFWSKKDEQNFSMLAFMKDKLCNKLGPHLDTIIHMFAQEFCTQNNFPYQEVITT